MVVKNTIGQLSEEVEAIGYIRQSDERDDKEDISEQTQLTKIKQYCDFNGWTLVKVFKDIDLSGFRISYTKRPGMMQSLQYIKENQQVKKFVIYNLSRLTRRRKDFLYIHEALVSHEVDLCSAAELLDFSTPTGRLIAGLLVDFNEYQSDNLSDVTKNNKLTNAQKGRWNGGPAPFGLKREGNVFVRDGINADAIRTMVDYALEGKGPFVIAKKMNLKKWKSQTGIDWSARRVRYVLNNPTYAGMQYWDGNYYPLKDYEQIMTWEEFNFIKSTLFGTEKAWKGRQRRLLTSMLYCPVCGAKMHSRRKGNTHTRIYVCNNKYDIKRCSFPTLDLASMDNAVLELIIDISKSRFAPEEVATKLIDGHNDVSKSIENLQDELAKLEKARHLVFDDFYINNKLTEEQFKSLMHRYDERGAEIQKQLNKIPIPKRNKYGEIEELLDEFESVVKTDLVEDDKRTLIELLVKKIIPGEETTIYLRWGETRTINATLSKSGRHLFY